MWQSKFKYLRASHTCLEVGHTVRHYRSADKYRIVEGIVATIIVLFSVCSAVAQVTTLTSTQSSQLNGILAACSTSHQSMYVSDGEHNQIFRINPLTDAISSIALPAPPLSMALSYDGQRLYVAMSNGQVRVLDISTTTESVVETITFNKSLKSIAVSPLGDVWGSTQISFDNLYCYNSGNAQVVSQSVSGNLASFLSTSPDGTKLLFYHDPGTVRVFDVSGSQHCSLSEKSSATTGIGSGMTDIRFNDSSNRLLQINSNQTRVQTLDFSLAQLSVGTTYAYTGPRAIAPVLNTQYLVVVDSLTTQAIPGTVLDLSNGSTLRTFNLSAFSFFAEQKKRQLAASCVSGPSNLIGLKAYSVVEDDFAANPSLGVVQSAVLVGTSTPTPTETPTATPTITVTPTSEPTLSPPPLDEPTPIPNATPTATQTPTQVPSNVGLGKLTVRKIPSKKFSVTIVVSNSSASKLGPFPINFYLSKAKPFSSTNASLLKKVVVRGVDAGKSQSFSFQMQRPKKVVAGSYYTAAVLDPLGTLGALNGDKLDDLSVTSGKQSY